MHNQQNNNNQFDVIVAGGGMAGCAAAYYLTKGGMNAALIEMREICSGASGRMGGQVLELEPVASEAAAGGKYTISKDDLKKKNKIAHHDKMLLDTLNDELNCDIEYVKNGSVVIAYSEEEADEIKKGVELQKESEDANIEYLSPSEVSRLYPVFGETQYGARYSEDDGNANPFRITCGYAYTAQKIGLKNSYVYDDKGCDCAMENLPIEVYLNQDTQSVHQVKKCSASCCGDEGIVLKKYEKDLTFNTVAT